jgi:hypothetical protein
MRASIFEQCRRHPQKKRWNVETKKLVKNDTTATLASARSGAYL